MKIKITIEYDPDAPEGETKEAILQYEEESWKKGHVDVYDILATGGKVQFELIS